MKFMIASDIHGSMFYLEKLLSCMEREKPDRLVLLGDILYHGPRNDLPEGYAPKNVIDALNKIKDKILCVRGNCDTEVDQMVLEFPVLADYGFISTEYGNVYLTHGHKYNEENLPPLSEGDILMCGHTHIPVVREHENFVYINPGSVSIPKENSPHSYIIYEEDKFIWKNLEGEVYNIWQQK